MDNQPKTNDDLAKEVGMFGGIILFGVFLLPIIISGLVFTILVNFIKDIKLRSIVLAIALITFIILLNVDFIAYFGYVTYMIDNFNFTLLKYVERILGSKPELSVISIFQYLTGGIIFGVLLTFYKDFQNKKIVKSKKEQKDKFYKSNKYKKVKKNRISLNEKVQEKYRNTPPANDVLLGIDEKGKETIQPFNEVNQHLLLAATTGGGKTVLLLDYVEHVMKNNIPMLFIDGKGSKGTIDDVKVIADLYGKKLRVFGEYYKMTYNPIKHGNATQITDKLLQLVQTESEYYSNINVALIQPLINFLDDYEIERNLQNLAFYLDPKEIKRVINDDVDIIEVEKKVKKAKPKENKAETKQFNVLDLVNDTPQQNELETEIKIEKKEVLTERAEKFKYRLFDRYESTKEGKNYLFENASTVRIVLNKLIESEIGHLFVESENELDLIEAVKNDEYIFVSLDGNIYDDFLRTIARFLILDINNLVSVVSRKELPKKDMLLVCDELSTYVNEKIIDTINKSREAKIHAILSVQSLYDLEEVSPVFKHRVIENTNTHIIGHTNSEESVDSWAKTFGTYEDKETTHVTEKSERSFIDRIDKTDDKGTVRNVQVFNIDPNIIRGLSEGQFVINRKASKERLPPQVFYARYPLNVGRKEDKNV